MEAKRTLVRLVIKRADIEGYLVGHFVSDRTGRPVIRGGEPLTTALVSRQDGDAATIRSLEANARRWHCEQHGLDLVCVTGAM